MTQTTPIIWVCEKCGFMSKTKYWAHITPKIGDSRTIDCNDDEGNSQKMIPYIPKSTHDELLEIAKEYLEKLEGWYDPDVDELEGQRIIEIQEAIAKAEGKECNQEQ